VPPAAPKVRRSVDTVAAKPALAHLAAWRAAIAGGDVAAYAKLLDPERFQAFEERGATPQAFAREAWLARGAKAWRDVASFELGPVRVQVETHTPPQRIWLSMPYRLETAQGGCTAGERRLAMDVDGQQVSLRGEWLNGVTACSEQDSADVAAAHAVLRRQLRGPEPEGATRLVQSILRVDAGVRAGEVAPEALATGEGRWIADLVVTTEAEFDNTRRFGAAGTVTAPGGATLLYRLDAGRWLLAGVFRGQP
jgi:hypothetical protein